MKRKAVLILAFLLLLFCSQYPRFQQNEARATDGYPVHNLSTGLNYTTIEEAISANETLDGNVIHVDGGTYYEHITINKSITLLGENRSTTTIDGNGTGTVVSITANDTTIRGFTIENTDWLGIQVSASNNVTIEDNNVIKAFYGIRVEGSSECKVARNIVENSTFLGILLDDSTNNTLRENQMTSNVENFGVWGLSLVPFVNDVDNSNIVDGKPICYLVNQDDKQIANDAGLAIIVNCTNITVKNLKVMNEDVGVMFRFTNSSFVENSTVSNCTYGIDLFYSYNNTIGNNRVFNNTEGISLRWSYENHIFKDTSTSNGDGIYLYSSDRNIVDNNEISHNSLYNDSYGIDLEQSKDNSFYHNNIVNNKFNLDPQSSSNNFWDNGLEGNYWSDYNGTDSNQDGIGDKPYIIDVNNADHYPLMGTFQSFNASDLLGLSQLKYAEVDIISNATIGEVYLAYQDNASSPTGMDTVLRLDEITGQNVTDSFCRITFPNAWLNSSNYPWITDFILNESSSRILSTNGTNTTIYFTFTAPVTSIGILPEFPFLLTLPSFLVTTLLATIVFRIRAHQRSRKSSSLKPSCNAL